MAVLPIARWFLPWACVLLVSATIAHATGDALERSLHEKPEPVVSALQASCSFACPHWVDLSSIERDGHAVHFRCLVTDGRYMGDALVVQFYDLNQVVSDMCAELWPP
jgi:hypothetical protein